MAFLFSRAKSRSDEMPRTAKSLLVSLLDPANTIKVENDLAKVLTQMKLTLQGTQEADSSPEVVAVLINSIIQEDLLLYLAQAIRLLSFEARKDTQSIFSYTLRWVPPQGNLTQPPAVSYIATTQPEIVIELCKGYEHSECALTCGSILREALKNEEVATIILYNEPDTEFKLEQVNDKKPTSGGGIFWRFFDWIHHGSFEVNTDAFTTFREMLTRHKGVVSNFLNANFDQFFSLYNNTLVMSPSYVTKRQSIKLLGEILLDRANYNVMMAYVANGDNLKLCMRLLKDSSKMVNYEGFHVFKVFVANPQKSVAVQKILILNRDRLLKFLPTFLEERTEDEQFQDEKSFLIHSIRNLPSQPVEPAQE